MDDLAIVVVSYNTAALLSACLRSVFASLGRTPELLASVVVVDNGSADGSPDVVKRGFPDVRLVTLDENRGFAAANNVGIRRAQARHVLLLNPDTEVLGLSIAGLVRFMDHNPRIGACGGRLLNPDLSFQHSCFHFPTLPMSFFDFFPINHRLVDSRLNGRYPRSWYARSFEIDHPLGACMVVRAETIQQVGPLDEGFFMYCEEVDWCYRIKQAGWKIAYTPDSEIIHIGGASARQTAGPMLVQLHRSRDRFFRKHYGTAFAFAARSIVGLGMSAAKRRARHQYESGLIDSDILDQQLALFDEVGEW